MEKFCIRRDISNCNEVNDLFNNLPNHHNRMYSGTGNTKYKDHGQDHDYLHHPPFLDNGSRVCNYVRKGYTEITIEEYRKLNMVTTSLRFRTLPKKWFIKVTKENLPFIKQVTSLPIEPGSLLKYDVTSPNVINECFELTFNEFRFWVLKEYITDDLRAGLVYLELPVSRDTLLDSYVKKQNEKNNKVPLGRKVSVWEHGSNADCLIFSEEMHWKKTSGKPGGKYKGDLKSIMANDIKYSSKMIETKIKEDKKLYYNVKPEYAKACRDYLAGSGVKYWTSKDAVLNDQAIKGALFESNSAIHKKMVKIGVLGIWFNESTDKTLVLPKIHGYNGIINAEKKEVVYGCAALCFDWFRSTSTRSIDRLYLSSGKFITTSDMNLIRGYLKGNGFI